MLFGAEQRDQHGTVPAKDPGIKADTYLHLLYSLCRYYDRDDRNLLTL